MILNKMDENSCNASGCKIRVSPASYISTITATEGVGGGRMNKGPMKYISAVDRYIDIFLPTTKVKVKQTCNVRIT